MKIKDFYVLCTKKELNNVMQINQTQIFLSSDINKINICQKWGGLPMHWDSLPPYESQPDAGIAAAAAKAHFVP